MTPKPRWDPAQYDRFKAQRAQPFHDLVALLRPVPAPRVVDLGCGTGELTAGLVETLGAAELLGLDLDAAMLAEALPRSGGPLRFGCADIAAFDDAGSWDIVLSNAALQWVPEHAAVLAQWVASLRPGGQLAVQVPANADHLSHRVAAEVAAEAPFHAAFGPAGPPPDAVVRNVLAPEAYARLLWDLGLREQTVRLQVYPHLLEGPEGLVAWVKGTTLTRFKARLAPEVYADFLEAYRGRLLDRLGAEEDARPGHPYLYTFKRILIWGRT